LLKNPDVVHQVLKEGAERARARATEVMERVRKHSGILRYRPDRV